MEKRFYLGVVLLVLFLVLGLVTAYAMKTTGEPVVQALEQAKHAILAGEPEEGIRLAQQAKQAWKRGWKGIASVADHTPMEEIDGLFAQLQYYADAGNTQRLGSCCARLVQLVKAVSDDHRLTWWNIL